MSFLCMWIGGDWRLNGECVFHEGVRGTEREREREGEEEREREWEGEGEGERGRRKKVKPPAQVHWDGDWPRYVNGIRLFFSPLPPCAEVKGLHSCVQVQSRAVERMMDRARSGLQLLCGSKWGREACKKHDLASRTPWMEHLWNLLWKWHLVQRRGGRDESQESGLFNVNGFKAWLFYVLLFISLFYYLFFTKTPFHFFFYLWLYCLAIAATLCNGDIFLSVNGYLIV